jgi:hypothetical protein
MQSRNVRLASSSASRVRLWWPDDHAWCVATDVDLMSTYVGGSADCIDRLVFDDELEAMVVPGDQSVQFDADTINPTPSGQLS